MDDLNKVRNILFEHGYIMLDYVSSTNIIALDDEGYKYKIRLSNLQHGKIPNKLMNNPFAYENFKLYLSKHYPDYKLIDSEYRGCKEKMRFICEKHQDKGIQLNSIDNIMNNHHACKYCSYEQMRRDRMTKETVSEQLCNDRNVVYAGRFAKDHETYIQYYCKKHEGQGIQSMSLTHFKCSKSPCRYCNISSGELKIQEYLTSNGIKYETQKVFEKCVLIRPLRFDFYLPDFNTVIEYDGQQHFKPVKFSRHIDLDKNLKITQERDRIKDEFCINNNINMVRIPYWDYNNIDNILASELSDAIFSAKS